MTEMMSFSTIPTPINADVQKTDVPTIEASECKLKAYTATKDTDQVMLLRYINAADSTEIL